MTAMPTPANGFSAARLQRLSERLRADVESELIPGAVALIIHRGCVAYFEAFGFANRTTQKRMAPDCIFRIASLTKPITATAALMLVERGELSLADPVARFLPMLGELDVGRESIDPATGERRLETERVRRTMTVHDLMRHTAGFTYGPFGDSLVQRAYRRANLMDGQQTNAELVDKLSRLPLAFQPGTTFEYGMSTDVLGRIVEVVSGLGLDRFIAERITGPLGMTATGFGLKAEASPRLAEPQADAAPGVAPAVALYNPAKLPLWFSGGGGLLSTAADYARFCRLLLNHGELEGVRILSRKTVEWMTANHLPPNIAFGPLTHELGAAAPLPALGQGYGLGLGVRVQDGLASVPGSAGDYYWGGATGPYFWVDPREQLIFVLMLQEQNAARRGRYRAIMRNLVYQALE